MRVTIDSAGRLVIPKSLRVQLGLGPGVELELDEYGGALRLEPVGGGSQLRKRGARLVAVAAEGVVVTDDDVRAAQDAGRR